MRRVTTGQRRPKFYEGCWKCGSCNSVYEFTRADEKLVCTESQAKGANVRDGMCKFIYHDDQRDGASLKGHCEVCGDVTYYSKTTCPPTDAQVRSYYGEQDNGVDYTGPYGMGGPGPYE